MTMHRFLLLVLACAAIALPLTIDGYRLFLVTMTLIMALGVLGLNILVGYNGQLSLGHGAFFALGAYTSAVLMEHAAMAWWITIPIAALACFVFGCLFGWPALRLKGHYLALATFGLALATPQLLKYRGLEKWTGGVQGIVLSKPQPPGFIPMSEDQWLYAVTLLITAAFFLLAWNLLRGRHGRAIVAIREHPIAASAMGVNVAMTKAVTFGISAMVTGVAGSLGAMASAYVAPDSFGIYVSIFFLVGAVVGGLGTISGALLGAAFIQFVPNIADGISKEAPSAVFALVLLLTIYLMPQGMAGIAAQLNRRIRRHTGLSTTTESIQSP